jgi:methionyl-tRNA formyltransferase
MTSVPAKPVTIVLAGHGIMAQALLMALLQCPDTNVLGALPWSVANGEDASDSDDRDFCIEIDSRGLQLETVGLINANDVQKAVTALAPDVLVLATWGEILSAQTLEALPCPVVNCHPALLPAYRGANPYTAVILNKEKVTGVTLHMVDAGVDTGPIIGQWECPVLSKDTGGALRLRCAELTAREVPQALVDWSIHRKTYPQSLASRKLADATNHKAKRLTLKDGYLDVVNRSASELQRQVRAVQPWVECFVVLPSKLLGRELLVATRQVDCIDVDHPNLNQLQAGQCMVNKPGHLLLKAAQGSFLQLTISNLYWGSVHIPKSWHNKLLSWLLTDGAIVLNQYLIN